MSEDTNMYIYYASQVFPDPMKWVAEHMGDTFYTYSDYKTEDIGDFCVKKSDAPVTKSYNYFKKLDGSRYSTSCHYQTYIGFLFDRKLYVSEMKMHTVYSTMSVQPIYDEMSGRWIDDIDNIRVTKRYIDKVEISRPVAVDCVPCHYVNIACTENGLPVKEKLAEDYPYAAAVQEESNIPVELFYCKPAIELLYKAGYYGLVRMATI